MILQGTDPNEYDMKCNDCGDIFWNLNGRFCPSCGSKNISDYIFEGVEKYNEYVRELIEKKNNSSKANESEIGIANLSGCEKGKHNFIVIYVDGYENDICEVVRWCSECGAITVDKEYDEQRNPGAVMKLKLPNITKERYNIKD